MDRPLGFCGGRRETGSQGFLYWTGAKYAWAALNERGRLQKAS